MVENARKVGRGCLSLCYNDLITMEPVLQQYIDGFDQFFPIQKDLMPWEITRDLAAMLPRLIAQLGSDFRIENDIAVHHSATIEHGVVLKGPIIIHENCFVGAHA